MTQNEIVQISLVALIVLGAIVWAVVRIVKVGKKKNTGSGCGCCSLAEACNLKEVKEKVKEKESQGPSCCHDGQSAKN